ncbi:hypothetical protein JCM17846_28010 [Iodidimonas nitroreducens]|uniref:Cytochrome c oxidase subunit I n=1 Tax=Iodidimonas nitroreducens TaxID=1236968 RepID=A0A5A7NDG2_9PROT|nr:DUF2189 domain-containing protein [Iodidimonas nitroreducens]GAK34135.1 putative integral membrane protein [alpha proteobacterium Q-1]GER05119.1 hypothetical protein JCM17846_28010 [Iodidimonas nitroreducens]
MNTAHAQNVSGSNEHSADVSKIRHIEISDVKAALRAGYGDFLKRPSHAIFLGLLYPILCFILVAAVTGRDLLPLVYPLIAGFTLVGPFAALGLYEMSRRREETGEIHWRDAFGVFRSAAFSQILMLGLLILLVFSLWILAAVLIYSHTLGTIASPAAPLAGMFSTTEGWMMVFVGNIVGAVFAVASFTISVVSFPMLLDKHVNAPTALATSIRAVIANPKALGYWGLIVVAGLFVGFLPMAVGLAVVFPILGHATWHLYRALIA